MSEKASELGTSSPEVTSISADQLDTLPAKGKADDALEYLKDHRTEGHFAHDERRMKRLRQRIDIRVIPFLALSYLVNFLDKILLNVSSTVSASSSVY